MGASTKTWFIAKLWLHQSFIEKSLAMLKPTLDDISLKMYLFLIKMLPFSFMLTKTSVLNWGRVRYDKVMFEMESVNIPGFKVITFLHGCAPKIVAQNSLLKFTETSFRGIWKAFSWMISMLDSLNCNSFSWLTWRDAKTLLSINLISQDSKINRWVWNPYPSNAVMLLSRRLKASEFLDNCIGCKKKLKQKLNCLSR